jgi:hypothetical protein
VPGGAAPVGHTVGYNLGYTRPQQDYPSDADVMPLRSILTTLNPVRNTVDPMVPVGADAGFFTPRFFVNINTTDPGGNNYPWWDQLIPDQDDDKLIPRILRAPVAPTTKVNVNTAGFADLWRSFMNVMAETARSTPFDFGKDYAIYDGNRFGLEAAAFASTPNNEHLARMFRSPLRPVGTEPTPGTENFTQVLRMHPFQVMTLRAAIAAVNTQALRSDLDVPDYQDTNTPPRFIIRDEMIPYTDILLPQVSPDHDPALDPRANTTAFYAGLGATVYGVKRQPFITEVLMSNNVEPIQGLAAPADQNKSGFVAIEIHNPYDRPMDVSGWKLSVIDRRPAPAAADPSDPEVNSGATRVKWTVTGTQNTLPALKMVDLPGNSVASTDPPTWDPTVGTLGGDATSGDPDGDGSQRFRFPPNTYIPPGGHLVVSNTPVDPTTVAALPATDIDSARYTPAGIDMAALFARSISQTTSTHAQIYRQGGLALAYAKYLHHAIGKEVVLSRPVVAYQDAGNTMADQIKHKLRWAPVDSFDSTGLKHQVFTTAVPDTTRALDTRIWHYARASDPAAGNPGRAWHFVYPGRYDASAPYTGAPGSRFHHQGTQVYTWPASPATTADTWNTTPPPGGITLGSLNAQNSRDNGVQNPTLVSTFPIQIANTDFTSQFDDSRLTMTGNPTAGFPSNPMHGFLRSGDIQHVTYIGSYTIWDAGDWAYDTSMPAQQNGNNKIPQPPYAYDPNGGFGTRRKSASLNPVFVEVNALPMDAAFAEDTDTFDDRNPWDDGLPEQRPLEDIGRFAPLNVVKRETGTGAPYFFADLQAQKYVGVTSGKDVDDGKISILETENPLSGRSLRAQFPNDFWNGYECIIFNDEPAAPGEWTVQQAYVATFIKSVTTPQGSRAKIQFVNKLAFDLFPTKADGTDRKYTFRLQRIRYGWATKLHEYFTTTRSPADDYSPNLDPDDDLVLRWGGVLREAAAAGQPYIPYPVPNVNAVKNVRDPSHSINRQIPKGVPAPPLPEDDVPTEGLVNINTASWRVLAQLPLVMREDDPTQVDHFATEYLARQIVYFRDIDDGRGFDPNDTNYADPTRRMFKPRPHGPFKSLFELLLIPEFEASRTPASDRPYPANTPPATGSPRNLLPTQNPNRDWRVIDRLNYDPSVNDGDFAPLTDPSNPRGDGVRWDWKEKYLMINRISNMVTLKSDCYTAYIQVQGWRDAGTKDATLVSQKRLAFIVDRSRVAGTKRTPTVYNVPVAE